ncbi:MAG: alpha-L-rhamnosidase C-terminal domain-containing protein, partial [Phycisphaerae bacterium]
KSFLGSGDSWRLGTEAMPRAPTLWCRSGRYVQLRITTEEQALTLMRVGVRRTGYPLDFEGKWRSSDAGWDRLLPIFENAFRISAHETWTDTPYYEQLCYVGDTTIHACSTYAWVRDDRLNRRAIKLFDWSRLATGLVAERYPSRDRQDSTTFSLIWPTMVRDFVMWRDDGIFVRSVLPGIRSLLAEVEGLAGADGLLHEVPGWPFVDWAVGWHQGCGPGMREGDSSIVNLHWVLALVAAAQVEEAHGDMTLAMRCRKWARRTMGKVLSRYWDPQRGVIRDTSISTVASEHAQAYALLSGLLSAKQTQGCLAALERGDLTPTTIYASYYVLNAFYMQGREEALHQRLAFWRTLPDLGFTATPETPEPTRSDSHAWGAHPAWHTLASVAGIRPAAPGFAKVRIAPLPGNLLEFVAQVVHPRGLVTMEYKRGANKTRCIVKLPTGVTGTLKLQGKVRKLGAGRNDVEV